MTYVNNKTDQLWWDVKMKITETYFNNKTLFKDTMYFDKKIFDIDEKFDHKNMWSNKETIFPTFNDEILKFIYENDLAKLQQKWRVMTSYFNTTMI